MADRLAELLGNVQAHQHDLAHVTRVLMKMDVYRNHLKQIAEEVEDAGKATAKESRDFIEWVDAMGEVAAQDTALESFEKIAKTAAERAGIDISRAAEMGSQAVGGIWSIAAVVQGAMEIKNNSNNPGKQAEGAVNAASGVLGTASAAMDLTAAVLGGAPVPGARVLAGISLVLGGAAVGIGQLVQDITMKHHYEHHDQGTENLFEGNTAQYNDDWYSEKYEQNPLGHFKGKDSGDRVFGPNVNEKPQFNHLKNVILAATAYERQFNAHQSDIYGASDLGERKLDDFDPEELRQWVKNNQGSVPDNALQSVNALAKRHLHFTRADKKGGMSGWFIEKDDDWRKQAKKISSLLDDKSSIRDSMKEDLKKTRDFLDKQSYDDLLRLKKSEAWTDRQVNDLGYNDDHIFAKHTEDLGYVEDEKRKKITELSWNAEKNSIEKDSWTLSKNANLNTMPWNKIRMLGRNDVDISNRDYEEDHTFAEKGSIRARVHNGEVDLQGTNPTLDF